jgi:conjugal transfer pilus assembly protein TraB
VQCQAVGDLSSEKAYLKPVVMTCADSPHTVIEIPVKGYVTSNGKVGIRGEIVSREGDLVTKSFLAGIIGGVGSGASQFYEPGYALSGGFAVKQSGADAAKNILGSGVGKGINESSSRLSDYLMKRAEQYQPVISIDEGVTVNLVFQEGFSMKEEDNGE